MSDFIYNVFVDFTTVGVRPAMHVNLWGGVLALDENTTTAGSCGNKTWWAFNEDNGMLRIFGSGSTVTAAESYGWERFAPQIKHISIGVNITGVPENLATGCPALENVIVFNKNCNATEILAGAATLTFATFGDVGGDGQVLADDVRTVLRRSVNLDGELGIVALAAADIDNDGVITAGDSRQILRHSVKLETEGWSQ